MPSAARMRDAGTPCHAHKKGHARHMALRIRTLRAWQQRGAGRGAHVHATSTGAFALCACPVAPKRQAARAAPHQTLLQHEEIACGPALVFEVTCVFD